MSGIENIISAFSAEHVERLTGLTKRQLAYMDRTGFFEPEYGYEDRSKPYSRIYSFKDLVALRTIAVLRLRHRIPLQRLRKVRAELTRHDRAPWTNLKLYILGKEVYFREPKTGRMRGAVGRQYVAEYAVQDIANDMAEKVASLKRRDPDDIGHVERRRHVTHNAWVVSGTRIPTRVIRQYHDEGYSIADILREYPSLTEKDVRAALEHEDVLAAEA